MAYYGHHDRSAGASGSASGGYPNPYRNSNLSYNGSYNPVDYEMGTVHSRSTSGFTARSTSTGVNVPLLASDARGAAGDAGFHAEGHHHEKGRRERHFYDRGSRTLAFVGILWSLQGAIGFAVLAAVVWIKAAPSRQCTTHCSEGDERYSDNSQGILVLWDIGVPDIILKLAFNAAVTMCNVATGNVHATTLKWALIKEDKPEFNANLRFFTAVGGWFSLNGYITNFLHIACLIISQASVSVIFLPGPNPGQTIIPSMVIMAIAASLLIQCILVLLAYWKTHVPTWSSSPLDVVAAAKDEGILRHAKYRCMRAAADMNERTEAAVNARKRQPNAWSTNKQVRYIVFLSWVMVFAAFLWSYVLFAVIAADISPRYIKNGCRVGGFVPTAGSLNKCYVSFTFNGWAAIKGSLPNNKSIGLNLGVLIIFQGILAAGLHLCELVVTLSRDEDVWRKASGRGAKHTGNQFYNFFSWKSILYLAFNPLLHWIMGNSLVIDQGSTAMYPMQVCISSLVPTSGHSINLTTLLDYLAHGWSHHYRKSCDRPRSF
jgi:hypothetical protein